MENKKKEEKLRRCGMETIILALIERFDDLEEETGKDFTYSKRIILRFAKKHKLIL